MIRLFANANYDFIKWRRWAYGLTAAIIIPGFALFLVHGLNYSIEFTGGTLIQVQTKEAVGTERIRSALDAAGIRDAEIQQFGGPTEYKIQARIAKEGVAEGSTEATAAAVDSALARGLGSGPEHYTIVRTEAVGPKVGRELQGKAFLAIFFSFIVTLFYLAFRFEWRFGLAAVLATFHDILTTIAFIRYLDLEVSLVVVGAVLTMVGYSLNDTIIIFDRVRENLHKFRRQNLYEILNLSINETLPRSVLTHGTTMATTIALVLLAGEVLRPFALVMTFAIFTGTFSSIYIAGPLQSGRVTGLVDDHCHLGDAAFDPDREAVLARAREAGVGHVVVIGTTLPESERAVVLAQAHAGLSATAGIHPHEARHWSAAAAARLRDLLVLPEVVALGETGLDYHYDHSPRDAQRRAFEAQLTLAREVRKPVVVHAREADDDVAAMLRGADTPVVLHSFSSGPGVFEAGMAIAAYFSFSGMITFKSWTMADALTACPPDRLLVETDGPYLAPVPHRGKRNEPAFVRFVAEALARARGEPVETIGQRTTDNACRLFGARLAR